MSCARAVQTVGYFGPFFQDGQGHCSHQCVPIQILTQFKHLGNELEQIIFPTKNAGFLFVLALWR